MQAESRQTAVLARSLGLQEGNGGIMNERPQALLCWSSGKDSA